MYATFRDYYGDLSDRFFEHFDAWKAGEERFVTEAEAELLKANHAAHFTFRKPTKADKTPEAPADPAKE